MICKSILFVLVLGEICLTVQSINWDYMVYSLEWPPAFCLSTKCNYNFTTKRFNIHGMWPNYFPKKEIAYCPGEPKFNITAIEPIKNKLLLEWADLKKNSEPNKFWKYEWNKHGMCAVIGKLITKEYDYFNIALILKEKYDVLRHFTENGFPPNNHSAYKTSNLLDVMQAIWGVRGELRCSRMKHSNKAANSYTDYLMEVHLCVDRALVLIDCPVKLSPKTTTGFDRQTFAAAAANAANAATTGIDYKQYPVGTIIPWQRLMPAMSLKEAVQLSHRAYSARTVYSTPRLGGTIACGDELMFPTF